MTNTNIERCPGCGLHPACVTPALRWSPANTDVSYKIVYSHGITERADTYEDAVAMVDATYPGCHVGHSGDIADGGESTWAWPDGASLDDDGSRAVAKISVLHHAD